jgi:Fe-S cluster assembly protein SufD
MSHAEETLLALAPATGRGAPGWLAERRLAARDRFAALGLPTTRLEDWKYTSLAPVVPVRFERAPAAQASATLAPASGIRLVFVDGRLDPRRSSSESGALPAGVRIESLGAALAEHAGLIEPRLGTLARVEANAFAALNTAAFEDGALIWIPDGARVEAPIELCFLSTPAPVGSGRGYFSAARNLVVAGRGSKATVVETYGATRDEDGTYLTSALTEVWVGEGAEVDHYRLQEDGGGGVHVGQVASVQAAGSRFSTHALSLGASLSRSEVNAKLDGEGAEVALRGLYVVGGKQVVDNLSLIEHARPHCSTRETYKGILDGSSRGVFAGRIRVAPGAQKTDAYQLNSNLLLSDDATVDSKPQLEIFADDVKCGHGGTVGQLNANALFYLQSRGIGRDEARAILTYAFASEMVGLIRPDFLRERVKRLVAARLPGGERLLEAA